MFPLPLLLLPLPLNPLPPFPLPLLFTFVGIAESPIPVDTRLKPDPPGLSQRSAVREVRFRRGVCLLLLWVLKHRFHRPFGTYPRLVLAGGIVWRHRPRPVVSGCVLFRFTATMTAAGIRAISSLAFVRVWGKREENNTYDAGCESETTC